MIFYIGFPKIVFNYLTTVCHRSKCHNKFPITNFKTSYLRIILDGQF